MVFGSSMKTGQIEVETICDRKRLLQPGGGKCRENRTLFVPPAEIGADVVLWRRGKADNRAQLGRKLSISTEENLAMITYLSYLGDLQKTQPLATVPRFTLQSERDINSA